MRVKESRNRFSSELEKLMYENRLLLDEVESLKRKLRALEKINLIVEKKLYLQTVFNEFIENISIFDSYYTIINQIINTLRNLFDFRIGLIFLDNKKEIFIFDNESITKQEVEFVYGYINDLKNDYNCIELFKFITSNDKEFKIKLNHYSLNLGGCKGKLGRIIFFINENIDINEYKKGFQLVTNALSLILSNYFMYEKNTIYQRSIKKQLDLFKILYHISISISRNKDLKENLDFILKRAIEELMGSGGSIQLIDLETNLLYIKAAFGLSPDTIKEFSIKVGHGIVGGVAKSGEPLVLYDIKTKKTLKCKRFTKMDVDFSKIYKKGERKNTKSAMCLPLKTSRGVVGVFNITSCNKVFGDEDIEKGILFTNLTAQIVENDMLNNKNKKQIERLSELNRISMRYLSVYKEDEIIELAIENISELVDIFACAIYLENSENPRIYYGYYRGKPLPEVHNYVKESLLKDVKLNNRLKRGKIYKFYDNLSPVISKNPESFIIVPIYLHNRFRGVIGFFKMPGSFLMQDEIETIHSFVAQLSISILNARIFKSMQINYFNTISVLASAIDAKDHYTHKHSENVMNLSVAIAREMKLPPLEIEYIKFAGLLHDIGKIGIDDKILRKPGNLDVFERKTVQSHPELGANIIKGIKIFKKIAPLTYYHHEKYDGTGYPEGLCGNEIPLGARILSVADAYDAMTSKRSYHEPMDKFLAIEEIKKQAGKHFDPDVVIAFERVIKGGKDKKINLNEFISFDFIKELEDF